MEKSAIRGLLSLFSFRDTVCHKQSGCMQRTDKLTYFKWKTLQKFSTIVCGVLFRTVLASEADVLYGYFHLAQFYHRIEESHLAGFHQMGQCEVGFLYDATV